MKRIRLTAKQHQDLQWQMISFGGPYLVASRLCAMGLHAVPVLTASERTVTASAGYAWDLEQRTDGGYTLVERET